MDVFFISSRDSDESLQHPHDATDRRRDLKDVFCLGPQEVTHKKSVERVALVGAGDITLNIKKKNAE